MPHMEKFQQFIGLVFAVHRISILYKRTYGQIFPDCHASKRLGKLKRSGNSMCTHPPWRSSTNIHTLEYYLAFIWHYHADNHIKDRSFACTIRAEQAQYFTFV